MGIGIDDLERLNALPKELSKPDMDLEKLKRLPEYRRRQWWDELLRVEEEYYGKYYLEGETNEYLEANIAMSKLKLIVSFSDNGEQCPVHSFKEDEMAFMRGFEELVVIGRLSVGELVDYFKRVKGKEQGLVKIAFDAVNRGYSVMDEIVRRSETPGDLANAFKRVYGERLKKMEETAKKYIDTYGLPAVEADINLLLEESKYEREKIIERLNQSLSNLEERLEEGVGEREEKGELERTLRGLEREVVTKETERAALNSKVRELERDMRDAEERYEKLESAWSECIVEIEERRKALDAKALALKEAEDRQRAELKETAQQAFEDELRDINTLKEELEKTEEELKSERAGLEYEKRGVEERVEKLKNVLEGGEVKRFVTGDVAKIHEMNYIGRFDIKMNVLPRTIYDPIEKKERRINAWSDHYRFDDADKILGTRKGDYDEATGKLPLNLRSRYVFADKKYKLFGKEETKVIVEAAVLGHLLEYLENGFDTRTVTLSELLSVLTHYIDRAELGNYFHVLGIASATGFDKKVLEHINSDEFRNNFVSRYVSLCLVDLETGEAFYNESDDRIEIYLPLFKPLFDEETMRAIREHVVERLELKDFAVLDRIVEEVTDGGEEGKRLAKKVFYDLEKEGKGEVRYDKEFWLVVVK
ncbi:Chromosome segregation ATPase [Methanophagales archaeon]|nr:Chromosome segregation ATPase [Methanophagales archaeon]